MPRRKTVPLPPPPKKKYNPVPFQQRLRELMAAHNESWREASLRSDLDRQAVCRYLSGRHPDRGAGLALADHYGINPNELLQLVGYAPMKFFDVTRSTAENLPPEAAAVALDIARIPEPGLRKEVAHAIRVLLKKYFVVSIRHD